jgi:glycosyltransferase involved in cell wall biosynthesis
VVIGDGPERAAVSALAADLLPGRHALLGSVPRERMADLYRQADGFLHMSQEEPFGIVYLEAAASGLPVVAHDGPVPRWILGDTALFADTSDVAAVAVSLRRALASDAASFGKAGRERILADWTWEQQAERYREFIQTLLARRADANHPLPAFSEVR